MKVVLHLLLIIGVDGFETQRRIKHSLRISRQAGFWDSVADFQKKIDEEAWDFFIGRKERQWSPDRRPIEERGKRAGPGPDSQVILFAPLLILRGASHSRLILKLAAVAT